MSPTITAEWHGVSWVSHPHSAGRCARHAEYGFLPVSAARAGRYRGPAHEDSTTRGGPTGPAQYAPETPYSPETRPGNTCPVSPWARSRSCYPFTLPLGSPSVIPETRGLHPLGPLLPAQTPPKAAEFGWTRETWLSVCPVAVPTFATAQQVQTARAQRSDRGGQQLAPETFGADSGHMAALVAILTAVAALVAAVAALLRAANGQSNSAATTKDPALQSDRERGLSAPPA